MELRAFRRVLAGAVVFGLLAANASCGSGTTQSGETAGPSTTAAGRLDEEVLRSALLTPADLPGRWSAGTVEVIEYRTEDGEAYFCPDGASVGLESLSLSLVLSHEASGEVYEEVSSPATAWHEAIDSCVGTTWQEGRDPVETFGVQALELPALPYPARGYTFVEYGGDYEYVWFLMADVILERGELVLQVRPPDGDDGPATRDLLETALRAAIARYEAAIP